MNSVLKHLSTAMVLRTSYQLLSLSYIHIVLVRGTYISPVTCG